MQQQILEALTRGANSDALATARDFVATNPDDPQAHRLLALAAGATGDVAAAQASIDRAIALAPDDADLHFQRAGLLVGAGQVDVAHEALRATVELDPNQLRAYILQAQLAIGRNDLDEAARLARLAARIDEEHPLLRTVEGMLALRAGAVDKAVAVLSQAAERAPDDLQPRYALGFAYMAKGHLAFAEQAFRSVLAKLPDAGMLRAMIAELLWRQGHAAAAADELAPLLADPATATTALRRFAGELNLAAGRNERALPLLQGALADNPGDQRTVSALTEAWRRMGLAQDARRTLDLALATSPDIDALWHARMVFMSDLDEGDALVARWRETLPASLAALEAEMTLHLSNARSDEAENVARAIAELAPGHEHAGLRLLLGEVRRAPKDAIARIEEMLLQGGLAPQRQQLLHEWRALAFDALDQPESTVALWTAQHRVVMDERLPLPELTAPRTDWPERAQPTGKEAPVAFLVGAPGSLVERLAAILSGSLATFRGDRFGPSAPPDALQHYSTPLRLASRELSPGNVASSWQMALPARGIKADVVDWLLWWDNALVALLRDQLPQARLVVALRDPRDMLLDWLAFGAATPMRIESPRLAAEWLAASLVQVADLHEQDLVPHRLVRMDDIADKPRAVAGLLGDALGISLPTPPPGLFGTDRLPAGRWRSYAGPLAGEFAILQPVARRLGYPES
ncbi:tetratricopeptide repeat protein [Luteimonas sp. MC1825]|uniref:tetratricopeptide repeat protein n=1 Tax=Luteimonas sp. MC1825 TaxID=2761107 RepID=UPI001613709D|nr:tetratricopeptide repeat protein [Luteimonas sp. MC1825]MBB6598108.1 tetratricopeptide repeat protein [Luteimonas sp. MC1825]QOC88342.1 tetratricopeptide repeat protein [Luteimonas sp. MC1825]